MTGIDPSQPAELPPAQQSPTPPEPAVSAPLSGPLEGGLSSSVAESLTTNAETGDAGGPERRRILIGSQRDPAAYRARRHRDWEPVVEPGAEGEGESPETQEGEPRRKRSRHRGGRRHGRGPRGPGEGAPPAIAGAPPAPQSPAPEVVAPASPMTPPVSRPEPVVPLAASLPPSTVPPAALPPVAAVAIPIAIVSPLAQPQATSTPSALPPIVSRRPQVSTETATELAAELSEAVAEELKAAEGGAARGRVAPPSRRDKLTPDLEDEFDRALGGVSLDELMAGSAPLANQTALEPESKHQGRVVAVRRDDVFLELGGREQGVVPLHQFPQPPQPGDVVEVVVQRFNPEEGLYDLRVPEAAVELGNWDEVSEGMLVETTVTGHNTGGLECEVNHIRGFIPVSQVALYRVEDLAPFVGQHFTCIILEANRERRNVVLSRRAVLEREKEEARKNFFDALQPGQVHQGTVRKILDFGAFVDIGGVDGLLHVSQLSWGRVSHPKDVLTEGQTIQVRIERIDRETGKIGFSYRDLLENPWATAAGKYPPNSIVKGKIVKLMDFGAFVELEPGVEGLIHISELAPKRVWRVSDVVKEGDEVEVLVLSVNTETQRISLSIKALSAPAEPTKKEKQEAEAGQLPAAPAKRKARPTGPLTGGLGRATGGDRFGLKW